MKFFYSLLCYFLFVICINAQTISKEFTKEDGFSSSDKIKIIASENMNGDSILVLMKENKEGTELFYIDPDTLEVQNQIHYGKNLKTLKNFILNTYVEDNTFSVMSTKLLSTDANAFAKMYNFAVSNYDQNGNVTKQIVDSYNPMAKFIGQYSASDKIVRLFIDKENNLHKVKQSSLEFKDEVLQIPYEGKLDKKLKSPNTAFINENQRTDFKSNSSLYKLYRDENDLLTLTIDTNNSTTVYQQKGDTFEPNTFGGKILYGINSNSILYKNKLIQHNIYENLLKLRVYDLMTKELLLEQDITVANYKEFTNKELTHFKSSQTDDKVFGSFEKFIKKLNSTGLKSSVAFSTTNNDNILQLKIGAYDDKVPFEAYVLSAMGGVAGGFSGGRLGFYGTTGMTDNEVTMTVYYDIENDILSTTFPKEKEPSLATRKFEQVLHFYQSTLFENTKNFGTFNIDDIHYMYFYSTAEKKFILRKY